MVIYASTQVPFHCRRIVAQALGMPVKKFRVIKPRIGGGFGSKQEMLLEDVCALMALRTRRPCFWQLTREENFRYGRTRHPIDFRLRTAMTAEGELTGIGMDAVCNTGAYGGHGLPVVGCCGSKVLPLYRWKHIHFDAKVVYTNLPVGGAYRGFGATQAYFAVESQLDEMSHAIGMDPVELRLKNHIQEGEGSPVFAALGEGKAGVEMTIGSCGLSECIRLGAEEIGWSRRTLPEEKSGRYRRGLGLATLMQGSSVPEIDMGAASIKMNEDGSFNLLFGATDLGTGADTVLAQIAAEELCTTVDKMLVYASDTDLTPFDVGAYASSTTYLSGEAVRKAAAKVKAQILGVAAEMLNKSPGRAARRGRQGRRQGRQRRGHLPGDRRSTRCTSATSSRSWTSPRTSPTSRRRRSAAHYVDVVVDTFTGKVRVEKYVAAIDCGTAINPKLAEGQTEGAVMNGVSYALCEEYLFDSKGKMTNASMQNYHIHSLRDKPKIKTILVPSYEDTGPFGAKSVSEICINGAAPAIGNAIFNATGARLRAFPVHPGAGLAGDPGADGDCPVRPGGRAVGLSRHPAHSGREVGLMEPYIWVGIILAVTGTIGEIVRYARMRSSKLMRAAEKEDRAAFRAMLKKKRVEINAPGVSGNRPLHVAAGLWGDEALVDELIARGAIVDVRNIHGQTPLYLAVERNNLDVIRDLLESGADVDAEDRKGVTPRQIAVRKHRKRTIALLDQYASR